MIIIPGHRFSVPLLGPYLAPLVLLLFLSGCTEQRIQAQLRETPGIEEISDFLSYEGTIFADVVLTNGGYIALNNLRKSTFIATDQIYVSQFGAYYIHCEYSGQSGTTGSGHNIVAIVAQSDSGEEPTPSTNNIAELVENYEYVLALISELPDLGEPGRKISFLHREPQEWDCFKLLQEGLTPDTTDGGVKFVE